VTDTDRQTKGHSIYRASIASRGKNVAWHHNSLIIIPFVVIHCESKEQDTKLLPITLPNINRFSEFFHC